MDWIIWVAGAACGVAGVALGAGVAWYVGRKRNRGDPSIATRRKMMAEINRLCHKEETFGVILMKFHGLQGNDGAGAKRLALEECRKILRIICVKYLDSKTSGVLRGTGYGGIVKDPKNAEILAQKIIMAFSTPLHVNGKPYMAHSSVGIRIVNDFFLPAWKIFAQADMAVSAAQENSWVAWSQEMEDAIMNIMVKENHLVQPLLEEGNEEDREKEKEEEASEVEEKIMAEKEKETARTESDKQARGE